MGMLVDGKWVDKWYDTEATEGRFVRSTSQFRSFITQDPQGPHPAQSGRYHLYVSLACPWAHRTLITRKLKGLESHITTSIVAPLMLDRGWEFNAEHPDPLYGCATLYELYLRADPRYTGRVTVPLLWDKQEEKAVSNESSEIIRMLNAAFGALGDESVSLYPEALASEIDEVNQRVYETINDGVYRCGFATSQEAYEEALSALFESLDWLEQRLASREYLVGEQLTEADLRLFTTLIRFDLVYFFHFKCNRKRILDYPSLSAYRRRLYALPAFASTVNADHIKRHYYGSHPTINPHGILPVGPDEWV